MGAVRNPSVEACCTPPALETHVGTEQGTGTALKHHRYLRLLLHLEFTPAAGTEVGTADPVAQYWNSVNQPQFLER